MCCGEQESGDKGEVVHEESKLSLVSGPMGWSMEGECQEQDIGGRKERRFGEVCAGEKARNESKLKPGREPMRGL